MDSEQNDINANNVAKFKKYYSELSQAHEMAVAKYGYKYACF